LKKKYFKLSVFIIVILLFTFKCFVTFGETSKEVKNIANQAKTLIKEGKYLKAIEKLEKARKFDANYGPIYFYLGLAYHLDARDFNKAIVHYKRYINLSPEDEYVNVAKYNIGDCYLCLDLKEDAIKWLNKAKEEFYNNNDAKYYKMALNKLIDITSGAKRQAYVKERDNPRPTVTPKVSVILKTTPTPKPTDTPVSEITIPPLPTNTPVPLSQPTDTPVPLPQPTDTPVPLPQPTNTSVPLPADTVVPLPEPTSTPVIPVMTTPVTIISNEMILIPAGHFWMGSDKTDKDALPQEKPKHKVYLRDYKIDRYEVSNAQYCEFLKAKKAEGDGRYKWIDIDNKECRIARHNGSYIVEDGYENYPVVCVSWYGANEFGTWTGKSLPTEAEWEKASRGTSGRIYPWGNVWDPLKCVNSIGGEKGILMEIGKSIESPTPDYKIMNMASNISEWCSDYYSEDYYTVSPNNNPFGPDSGSLKSVRGGNYKSDKIFYFRTTYRRGINPTETHPLIGFRLVTIFQ